jgi:hypothetical protein
MELPEAAAMPAGLLRLYEGSIQALFRLSQEWEGRGRRLQIAYCLETGVCARQELVLSMYLNAD